MKFKYRFMSIMITLALVITTMPISAAGVYASEEQSQEEPAIRGFVVPAAIADYGDDDSAGSGNGYKLLSVDPSDDVSDADKVTDESNEDADSEDAKATDENSDDEILDDSESYDAESAQEAAQKIFDELLSEENDSAESGTPAEIADEGDADDIEFIDDADISEDSMANGNGTDSMNDDPADNVSTVNDSNDEDFQADGSVNQNDISDNQPKITKGSDVAGSGTESSITDGSSANGSASYDEMNAEDISTNGTDAGLTTDGLTGDAGLTTNDSLTDDADTNADSDNADLLDDGDSTTDPNGNDSSTENPTDNPSTDQQDEDIPYSQMNEEQKAAASAAARAKVSACKKALSSAQAEQEAAQKKYNNVGRYFIDSKSGSKISIKILTNLYKKNSKLKKYASKTEYTKSIASALTQTNLKKAADYVTTCNSYRKKAGLPELKISYRMMCYAATAAAIAYESNSHVTINQFYKGAFPTLDNYLSLNGENLAWAYKNPYKYWYTEEKAIFDDYSNDTEEYPDIKTMTPNEVNKKYPEVFMACGHYLNIMDPQAVATGFAHNSYKSSFLTNEQCFSENESKNGDLVTPTQFKSALASYAKPYKTALDNAKKKVSTAKKNLSKAQAELDAILISVKGASIHGTKTYVYNGKACKPKVKVYLKGKLLNPKSYKVTYKNNKNPGTATVTITGIDAYGKSASKTFKIKPSGTYIRKLKKSKKAFTVKWKKKSSQVSGYQIQYSRSKSFKGAKTTSVKSRKITSKKIKHLKKKKKYYVRIRTFKTVKGKRIYSNWSRTRVVKTK